MRFFAVTFQLMVPGSLPYYQLSDLLQLHPKGSYKIVEESHGNLRKRAASEIVEFLISKTLPSDKNRF
jgi:hypothetical protein